MYFVHDIPGRLRVKIDYLRNHPERLKEIRTLLDVPGVFRVKSNPMTGSTVVEYDADVVNSGHLLVILKTNGYAIDLEKNAIDRKIRETHEKMAMKVSKAAVSWLAGRVL
ncbi:MAG: hypothetical protein LC660_16675, partial [Desulfobacteraceae bacterium]|nr:hypothetical protein [Desulfobacteraceae bacterium]